MPLFSRHAKGQGPAPAGEKQTGEPPQGNSVVISGENQGAIQGGEQTLIQIPEAIAHLVDREQSAHLATGTFSLVRLSAHDGKGIAVFAKVGDELQWPLTKDIPTAKLDATHYFFSLKAPPETANEKGDVRADPQDAPDLLNYGITFASGGQKSLLTQLDKYLEHYSFFSLPQIVQGPPERRGELEREAEGKKAGRLDRIEAFLSGKKDPAVKRITIPKGAKFNEVPASITSPSERQQYLEGKSAAYWTTLAPNVEDYSSSMAQTVSGPSKYLVRGLFWCSDNTVGQLDRLGDYAKAHIETREKPMKIGAFTMRNLGRVRQVSRMTDQVAKGILAGIITATGLASGSLLRTKAGKKFSRMLPGQVALVSLDAFGKVFDAVELAGRSVLNGTRVVTCDVVSHRYGEDAAEATHHGMATAGHVFSIAWTISKIRKALNPSKGGGRFSKKAFLKSKVLGKAPAAAA